MAAISHAIIPQLNLIDAQTSHLIHTQTSSPIRRCSHSHPNNQTSSPILLLFTRRCWSPLTAAALLTVEKTGASSSSEALERRSVNLTPVQFLLQIGEYCFQKWLFVLQSNQKESPSFSNRTS